MNRQSTRLQLLCRSRHGPRIWETHWWVQRPRRCRRQSLSRSSRHRRPSRRMESRLLSMVAVRDSFPPDPLHASYLRRYVPGYLKELQDGHAEELGLFRKHLEDVRQQIVRSSSSSFSYRPHFDLLPAYRSEARQPRNRSQSTSSRNRRPLASRTTRRRTLLDPCSVRAATQGQVRSAWGFWRPHVIQRRREEFKRSLMRSLGGSVVSHVDPRRNTTHMRLFFLLAPTFADEDELPQLNAFVLETFRWRPVTAGGQFLLPFSSSISKQN